jgi:hypothetical protein
MLPLFVAREEERSLRELADRRAAAAQELTSRRVREAEQREQRADAAVAVASVQVEEFRSTLGRLERERDALLEEKRSREKASAAAAQAVAAARRWEK